MPITKEIIEKVAADTGITMDKLPVSGLLALLQDKRRKIMIDKLDMLARYDVASAEELEKKIKDGKIPEHPTWEDLILLENLEASLALIDEDIKVLQ
mgnify:FL=1